MGKLDRRRAIVFIAGADPVCDLKYSAERHPRHGELGCAKGQQVLSQIISLVSGSVLFLGGFLVVWGAVSLGLAIREQQGCAQIASAISTIAREADWMEGYRR